MKLIFFFRDSSMPMSLSDPEASIIKMEEENQTAVLIELHSLLYIQVVHGTEITCWLVG